MSKVREAARLAPADAPESAIRVTLISLGWLCAASTPLSPPLLKRYQPCSYFNGIVKHLDIHERTE